MKQLLILTLSAATLVFLSGCEDAQLLGNSDFDNIYAAYSARRVHITGLTEVEFSGEYDNGYVLTAYVDLLDDFGSRVKSPGVFRFELYEFLPRVSEPRGRRVTVWPDIELIEPDKNNDYWQDFLRTYKFQLSMNFIPSRDDKFIFSTTFITPDDVRITDEYSLVIED